MISAWVGEVGGGAPGKAVAGAEPTTARHGHYAVRLAGQSRKLSGAN